eukprot:scaffold37995_cov185-Skeletonema_marinoi.AAC.1
MICEGNCHFFLFPPLSSSPSSEAATSYIPATGHELITDKRFQLQYLHWATNHNKWQESECFVL